ncbi:hypothetical protein [Arsenophonus endosymbiont of Crataerina pallida]
MQLLYIDMQFLRLIGSKAQHEAQQKIISLILKGFLAQQSAT